MARQIVAGHFTFWKYLCMKTKATITLGLTLILLIGFPSNSIATIKTGATCKKLGKSVKIGAKLHTCIKAGKKQVWDKGVETAQKLEVSELASYRNIEQCKLQNRTNDSSVSQAFPLNPYRVKTTSIIDVLVFPIDFPDLIGTSNPLIDFDYITKGVTNYFEAMSDDQIMMNWTIYPKFVRLNENVSTLRLGGRTADGYEDFSRKAFALAKATTDVSKFEIILYAPPKNTTRDQIAVGPAFIARQKEDVNATMLDGQSYEVDKIGFTTAHEFGHLMGLADLYNFNAANESSNGGDRSIFEKQFRYMGIFDLMNYANGDANELTSWNRWLIELINDSQMRCLPERETLTLLTPMSSKGGVKGAVIPISDSEVIVMESRRSSRYDKKIGIKNEGLLIYRVDSTIESGSGPMSVVRKKGSVDVWYRDSLLKINEELIVQGYKIRVVGQSAEGDFVSVTKFS